MNRFHQKYGPWAFVTGATEGIGFAIAELLASYQLNLVLVGRRENVLKKTSDNLEEKYKIKTIILVLDLSSSDCLREIELKTNNLDIGLFVAAAGFGSSGEFVKLSISDELNMVDVNCRAVVGQTHYFANRMIQNGRGGIILFSSLVAFQGTPYSATYSATKSFIQNFAEALHFELKSKGIDVLSCAPGPVNTGFALRAKMKMGSAAMPKEVAQSTLHALGSYITVRPGFLSKLLGYSLLTMNRWGRIQVMKKIMSGMTSQ